MWFLDVDAASIGVRASANVAQIDWNFKLPNPHEAIFRD